MSGLRKSAGTLFDISQSLLRNLSFHGLHVRRIRGGNAEVPNHKPLRIGLQEAFWVKPTVRKKAEAAMLDYFYGTRGLQFLIAESMSKNAPVFLENVLKKINGSTDVADVAQSISRYLRFHPVNEFEPFLESLGFKQSEYCNLLPAGKMFLNEDTLLLENHDVLCNYGIGRKKMGKIYKEAIAVFGYGTGVLASKIQAYEDMGLNKSCLSKLMVCSPSILIGDKNVEFANVLEILKSVGLGDNWLVESLSEKESYDWSGVHRALNFLRDIGFHEDELCGLIRKHPRLIFESSGKWTLMLVGFQTKLGSSKSEIRSFFQQLTRIEVETFVANLRRCFLFLKDIEMKTDDIGKIFRSDSLWLGACSLKKTGSLLNNLNAGKKRLCEIILENPEEMKKWTLGSRIQPLPDTGEEIKSKMMKTRFLLDIGYEENSKDMDRAIKNFRGRGSELRERYDFIVSLGLNEKDVREMVKASPQILCQGSEIVKAKVDYLVNKLRTTERRITSWR
ncbi:PREDICTED: transcription termination factor MTEF18, mitochondrial-like isoform X2 [Tarenaya hassleriana]|uniref:transcription termination factor MTEF18, mitochondrial-like isoform X2 n=1 Tax=Tarenaya hassleriana TaxID=28532 RepID=UPI00053C09F9|nr:PREDICTED: transcription termination factor MTEF18, mitochondrial-like isoform X2 [Tarenaya hassleriana]